MGNTYGGVPIIHLLDVYPDIFPDGTARRRCWQCKRLDVRVRAYRWVVCLRNDHDFCSDGCHALYHFKRGDDL